MSELSQESRVAAAERAIDQRPLERGASRRDHVLQTRALKSLLRRGTSLPGGATVNRTNGDPDAALAVLDRVAAQCIGGTHPRWAETQVGQRIQAALGRSNFSADSFPVNHQETRGLNMNWTGSVNLRIENPTEIGNGTGESTATGGGSSSTTGGTTSSSTDSAELSGGGSAGGHNGAPGGEAGVKVGTSSTTDRSDSATDSASSGTSIVTRDTVKRYRATIIINVSLTATPDFSGSDYVNPFKWGFAGVTGAASAMDATSSSGSDTCGTVEYTVSTGIAPTR